MGVYAKHDYSADSDIAGNEETVEAVKVFVKEIVALVLKRTINNRRVPLKLASVQVVLARIMHFF